jgi:hypothetical protein
MLNIATNKTWERRLSSAAFTFLFYEKQHRILSLIHNCKLTKIKRVSTVKDLWVLSNKENIF